jgi:hypothetical protein
MAADVVINFSNVSVSVALIFGGVFLYWQGCITNMENLKFTGIVSLFTLPQSLLMERTDHHQMHL